MLEQPGKTAHQPSGLPPESIYLRGKLTCLLLKLLSFWLCSSFLISAQTDPTGHNYVRYDTCTKADSKKKKKSSAFCTPWDRISHPFGLHPCPLTFGLLGLCPAVLRKVSDVREAVCFFSRDTLCSLRQGSRSESSEPT